jgi:hypothetical protein
MMNPVQLFQGGAGPDFSPYEQPAPASAYQVHPAQVVSPLSGLSKVIQNYTAQQQQKTQQQKLAEALRQMQAAKAANLPGYGAAQVSQ